MKRICIGLIAVLLAVSLCACGGDPAVSDPAPSTTTTAATTDTTVTTTTTRSSLSLSTLKSATSITTPTTRKPTTQIPVVEISAEELAGKRYCKASVEEDFVGQTVLITLQRSVSATHHLFTVEEFREMFGIEIVRAKAICWTDPSNENALVNWEKYRQIYTLTIPQRGKQAVLDAIKIIEQHPYVHVAKPNYIVVSDLDTE